MQKRKREKEGERRKREQMENKNDRFDRYGTEGKMRNERQELTD